MPPADKETYGTGFHDTGTVFGSRAVMDGSGD
jgi:hypothetical protein